MSRPTQKPVSKPQVKQTMKPVEKPIVKASGEPKQENSKVQDTNSNFKAKNFMIDDDEFEFEFLNWDGDENM